MTLRALTGEPLAEPAVRDMVMAAAEAIAERSGVRLHAVMAAPDRLTLTIGGDRLTAIGFAAEVRRLTTAWHRGKYGGGDLWGEVRRETLDDDEDEGEGWKGGGGL